MHAPSPARRRGFSLIEVMVSVVVLSFGLIGLVALQGRAVQITANAEEQNRAALLANEVASSMWAARTVNLSASAVADWQARVANAASGGLPNGTGAVAASANVATVTITWRPPRAASGTTNRFVTHVVVQ